jgi:hypothetical protein
MTLCGSNECVDIATEFGETTQVIAFKLGGVHSVEVIGSEIVEVHAVAEHVVSDDEDAVGHSDAGSFRSTALADASELRTQITLAGVGRCPGALQKHGAEPVVSRARADVPVARPFFVSSLQGIAIEGAWGHDARGGTTTALSRQR